LEKTITVFSGKKEAENEPQKTKTGVPCKSCSPEQIKAVHKETSAVGLVDVQDNFKRRLSQSMKR